jgi:hypothetical protein
MTVKPHHIAPLLALGAIAAAITTTADASAATERTCANGGGATTCQSPGNVEVHANPPVVRSPLIYGPFSSPIPFLFN